MAVFVTPDWVQKRLGQEGYLVIDPRSAMRYLQGHLQGAVNLPLRKLLDGQGRLLPVDQLAEVMGSVGLNDLRTPVLYDSYDGRNAAMISWVLEYLGRDDVHIMDVFFGQWTDHGGQIFYRPVLPTPYRFTALTNPKVRATKEEIASSSGLKLMDNRTRAEYNGETESDDRPGHIPGAVNVVWEDLLGQDGRFLSTVAWALRTLGMANVRKGDQIVAYCRTGLRASVAYLALKQMGYDVRLYDGSFAEWAESGMPVERAEGEVQVSP
jgi:thiosulfate/3-mercaptopyruvate sulfurtransferase